MPRDLVFAIGDENLAFRFNFRGLQFVYTPGDYMFRLRVLNPKPQSLTPKP